MTDIRRVGRLELGRLPRAEVSRLLVELVQDGLGGAVRVPVLVVRGREDGPVFGLTAALHGNELNGIPAIHRLVRQLKPRQLRGTVVAVVVANVPGLLARTRRFVDNVDLNHVLPGRPDGNASSVYVHRLVDRVVRHVDLLCDLHTASFGRVNSLYVRADLADARTRRMALRARPQIAVHNPPHDGTLRGHVQALGIPAITVEIGNPQRFQRDMVRRAVSGLRALLADAEMLPRRRLAPLPPPVICEHSEWLYTPRGGLLEVQPAVAELIGAGEPLARMTSIFGEPILEIPSPRDAVVVGKSVDPVAESGARIAHLGTVAPPGAFTEEPR